MSDCRKIPARHAGLVLLVAAPLAGSVARKEINARLAARGR